MIEGGETETLDFKKEITSEWKIAKTIVSFANRKGGILLVGVNDEKKITGVFAEEDRHMIEKAVSGFCKPEIALEITEHPLSRKKSLLEVTIAEGKHKPYFAKGEDEKWWAYIRVNDQSLLASKVMLEVLRRETAKTETLVEYTSSEQALFHYLIQNDRITLKQFCRLINISRWRAQKILVNLVSIGVVRVHTTEKSDYYTMS